MQVSAVTALQEAYIRKVIDTVNDLDNVLYEISNESNSDFSPGKVTWLIISTNTKRGNRNNIPWA